MINKDSAVGGCRGNPLPGRVDEDLTGPSCGLQCQSWIVIGETDLGPAERERTGHSRKSELFMKACQRLGVWETWLHDGALVGDSQLAGTRV